MSPGLQGLVSGQQGEDVNVEIVEKIEDKIPPHTVSAEEKVSEGGARSLGEKRAVLTGVSYKYFIDSVLSSD